MLFVSLVSATLLLISSLAVLANTAHFLGPKARVFCSLETKPLTSPSRHSTPTLAQSYIDGSVTLVPNSHGGGQVIVSSHATTVSATVQAEYRLNNDVYEWNLV